MASACVDGGAKAISPIRTTSQEFEKQQLMLKDYSDTSQPSFREKRTLVVEEHSFIETFLRCLICRELFASDERAPKLLPCHHSLCLTCILKVFKTENDYRSSFLGGLGSSTATIICPICCKHFISTEAGLNQLPTDHRIIQLIDFVKNTEVQEVEYCTKHQKEPLNFFCELCCQRVCRGCTIIDHKESKGHKVFDIAEAIKTYLPVLESAMSEVEAENKELKEKRQTVEQALESMDKAESDLVTDIRASFNRIRELLEEREKELIEAAENDVGCEKKKLQDKIDVIEKRQTELNEKHEDLKNIKDQGDVERMYKAKEENKDYKAAVPPKIKEISDGTLTKFTFNDHDEKYLNNRIKNFGEVVSHMESSVTKPSSYVTTGSTYSSGYGSPYRYTPSSYSSYGGYNAYRYK